MKSKNKLGIWMDHSIAYIMELTSNPFEIKTIESKVTPQKKMETSVISENLLLPKEKKQLYSYYRKLSHVIKGYKRVLLFGPTNAKVELFDILSEDESFINIKFEIKETDKMTANQKDDFVKSYFAKG